LVLVPTNTTKTAAYAAVIPRTSFQEPSENFATITATRKTERLDTTKLFCTVPWIAMMIIGKIRAKPPNIAPQTLLMKVSDQCAYAVEMPW
jgi:hypothetical protein